MAQDGEFQLEVCPSQQKPAALHWSAQDSASTLEDHSARTSSAGRLGVRELRLGELPGRCIMMQEASVGDQPRGSGLSFARSSRVNSRKHS